VGPAFQYDEENSSGDDERDCQDQSVKVFHVEHNAELNQVFHVEHFVLFPPTLTRMDERSTWNTRAISGREMFHVEHFCGKMAVTCL
jgi:hypothetical protein